MLRIELLSIGFDKNHEPDFRASMQIAEMSLDDMQKLRAMIPVAIAQLELLWRDHGPNSKHLAYQKKS